MCNSYPFFTKNPAHLCMWIEAAFPSRQIFIGLPSALVEGDFLGCLVFTGTFSDLLWCKI